MDQRIIEEQQKIAYLTKEQEQKIQSIENELGCVLVAYQTKSQAHDNLK